MPHRLHERKDLVDEPTREHLLSDDERGPPRFEKSGDGRLVVGNLLRQCERLVAACPGRAELVPRRQHVRLE